MRKVILSILATLASTTMMAQFESAPAFPGAEGHGRFVTGGRGGKVIHVTNLNDSGTGSLRAALAQSGKRIIVFDVSGYIDLKSELAFSKGDVTIAGQTAPGDGITLRYYTFRPNASNVIVRYIRFRRSQIKDVNDGADACWTRNYSNIIFDHCSFSWSIDELASFYDNKNFTLQWCTLGEALRNAGHTKSEHSYGGIWGGKNASFHHNFLAHMQNRVPRFNGARYKWGGYDSQYANTVDAERVDFRNCVMYNWGNGNGCYGGPGGGYVNIVNNYYKAGPATYNKTRVTQISKGESGNSTPSDMQDMTSLYYIKGNYVTAASNPANYDWAGVKYDQTSYKLGSDYYTPDKNDYYKSATHTTINGVSCVKIKLDNQIDPGFVTTHSAEKAYEKVLAYAGASYARDAVDARYMEEAKNGTTTYKGTATVAGDGKDVTPLAGIIDLIQDPNKEIDSRFAAYPALKSVSRPADFDTDQDGMPDAWETANGLNPNDATDGSAKTLDSKGYYTNVEVYINSLVEHIVKAERADAESSFEEYYPSSTSGITNLEVSKQKKDVIYNLNGQRVSASAKGLLIKNGRKHVVKD